MFPPATDPEPAPGIGGGATMGWLGIGAGGGPRCGGGRGGGGGSDCVAHGHQPCAATSVAPPAIANPKPSAPAARHAFANFRICRPASCIRSPVRRNRRPAPRSRLFCCVLDDAKHHHRQSTIIECAATRSMKPNCGICAHQHFPQAGNGRRIGPVSRCSTV